MKCLAGIRKGTGPLITKAAVQITADPMIGRQPVLSGHGKFTCGSYYLNELLLIVYSIYYFVMRGREFYVEEESVDSSTDCGLRFGSWGNVF